jgi:hypothetical protein
VKIPCLILALLISFSLSFPPCQAKRAYMWTDEKGVHHISDQPPPKDIHATSFSTDRASPKENAGVSETRQPANLPQEETALTTTDHAKKTDSSSSGTANPASQEPPTYRNMADLSREEQARVVVLKAREDRTKQYYEQASSEEERRRWKEELDSIEAEAKNILEPKGR